MIIRFLNCLVGYVNVDGASGIKYKNNVVVYSYKVYITYVYLPTHYLCVHIDFQGQKGLTKLFSDGFLEYFTIFYVIKLEQTAI